MLSQLICNHSLCISCFKQYYYCDKKNEKIQEFVWYVVNDGRLKWKIIIMLCLIGYIYTKLNLFDDNLDWSILYPSYFSSENKIFSMLHDAKFSKEHLISNWLSC